MGHVVASVVLSLMFVFVSCIPATLEKANFVAQPHHIQRRAPPPAHPPTVHTNGTLSNDTDDNSTMPNTNKGILNNFTIYVQKKADVIYRALAVLGCISAIVVVYISFRYFR